MKTNRELLELAAKAVGYKGVVTEYQNGYVEMGLSNHFKHNGSNVWNPLTDDGDRYRLLSKLYARIDFESRVVIIGSVFIRWPEDEPDEAHAIVRAAAEIGART